MKLLARRGGHAGRRLLTAGLALGVLAFARTLLHHELVEGSGWVAGW